MPIDPEPHPAGNVIPHNRDDGTQVAIVLGPAESARDDGLRWRTHFETCRPARTLSTP